MLGLSKRGIICAGLSVIIMLSFFIMKTLVMADWVVCTPEVEWFEYLSVIGFMPPFFILFREMVVNQRDNILRRKSLESILDESCLVSRTDKKGRIVDVNNKFCEVSGYKRQELLGKDHAILNSGTHPKEMWVEMYQTTIKYKSIWHDIVTNRNKKGDLYIVDSYIMATFNTEGKHDGFISVRQDITSLMNTLQEVDRKNAYLEHAAKILRHDMHSGINTYIPRGITSLERRLEKIQKSIDPDTIYKEWKQLDSPLKMLKEGLSHAQKVYSGVKEFTNLVKKDAQLDKSYHMLDEILISFLKSTAYYSQVKIEELPKVEVNESLFCTAIDNLIRNGLRYNDNPSKQIKIYMEKDHLIVEDNGRGMTLEEFKEFSKPYTRNKNNKESGSGLGLNICIAIMKEHGFDVSCEKIDVGTKIKINLK